MDKFHTDWRNRLKILFLVLSLLILPTKLLAAPVSFQLTWEAGEVITTPAAQPLVTWSGITNPTPMDWIGLYTVGTPDGQFIDWMYVSCSKSPDTAKASGSCSFPLPISLPSGGYEFRLFANDGFTRLAVLSTVAVPLTGSTNAPDGFKVERKTGTGQFTEIAKTGLEPRYVDSIETGPGGFNVCWRVAAFNAAGDSDYTNEACEFINYVAPETLLVTSDPDPKVTGRVAWSNINNPSPTDWMGLYQPGLSDRTFLFWFYTDCSHIGTLVLESGSCLFTLSPDMPEGDYEFRFFAQDGFVRLATSNPFVISYGPELHVLPSVIFSGDMVTISWRNIPVPTLTDWIGFYIPNSSPASFGTWFYTVSCSTSVGVVVQVVNPDGACESSFIAEPGVYEIRLYANDGFDNLIASTFIEVK